MDRPGTVVIVGLGLIGGSVGLAIRRRKAADRVIGVDLDPDRLATARRLGAIDEAATDLAAAVADAEVALIATPVTGSVPLALRAARAGRPDLLITDVGSTKGRIVAALEGAPATLSRFVGSHPIAGSERQGVENARADLFEGRICALTPTARTPPDRVDRCRRFWSSLGATTLLLDPAEHDRRLARTSHLPHALASALAALVPPDLLPLAAGAYRDGTRVAGADADLWAGIFLDNRPALLDAIDALQAEMADCRAALADGDATRLAAWWSRGRAHRSQYRDRPASPPA